MSENTTSVESAAGEAAAKKKKKWPIVLLVVLLVLAAIGAGIFLFIRSKFNRMGQEEETFDRDDVYVNTTAAPTSEAEIDTAEASEEESREDGNQKKKKTVATTAAQTTTAAASGEKSYTTFVVYGVDARNTTDLERDANADSTMICVIDNDTSEIKICSVLRDILVETPSGYRTKLTNVYAGYGVKESLGTINKCLDLSITQYVTVNWTALATAVNALGGIDVELTEAEINYINYNNEGMGRRVGIESDPIEYVGDGLYHINGVHAVMHAANRSVGMHDISRAERQRTIMKAMLKQAKSCSLSQLNDAVNAVLPYVSTNLTLTEILSMAVRVADYDITETATFPYTYVNQEDLTSALVYCNTLTSNVIQLHKFLYGVEAYEPNEMVYQVDDYIQSYRASHP